MSRDNPLRGAPRIYGGLLMLGFEVSESTVGRYMIAGRPPVNRETRKLIRQMCLANPALGCAADSRRVAQARY
jgi:hypothetical protein